MHSEAWDALLRWCVEQRASDITIQTDQPCFIEVDGFLHPVTRRAFDSAELEVFVPKIYRSPTAMGNLAKGQDLDFAYEVEVSRNERLRFRVNVTAGIAGGRNGVQVTMRVMPQRIPTIEELKVPAAIVEGMAQDNGLVFVTGPTGSGKSTLMASVCRYMVEVVGIGKMVTYESPVEMLHDYFDATKHPHSLPFQSEIGPTGHLPSFDAGVRNGLRRKPGLIVVGEMRDKETILGGILAAQTGHVTMGTGHAKRVASLIRRLIAQFPVNEQSGLGYDLLDNLRFVVAQLLEPKIGGGRVPLQEYLLFTDEIREDLLDRPQEEWGRRLQHFVKTRGQSMEAAAEAALERGDISEIQYAKVTGKPFLKMEGAAE